MADFKFDYISDYKIVGEGYIDPLEYGSEDDYYEYYEERGYIVKHNGHKFKVSDWVFITKKQWKVEEWDPNPEYNTKWTYKGDYETLDLALARVKELAE